jgi:hypothetical protein
VGWGSDHELWITVPQRRRDRFYVYIAWGEDRSRPLYVGKGNSIWDRIGHHMLNKRWADDVVEFECHAFPTMLDALEAEKNTIEDLNPIHNVLRISGRRQFVRNYRAWIRGKLDVSTQ